MSTMKCSLSQNIFLSPWNMLSLSRRSPGIPRYTQLTVILFWNNLSTNVRYYQKKSSYDTWNSVILNSVAHTCVIKMISLECFLCMTNQFCSTLHWKMQAFIHDQVTQTGRTLKGNDCNAASVSLLLKNVQNLNFSTWTSHVQNIGISNKLKTILLNCFVKWKQLLIPFRLIK